MIYIALYIAVLKFNTQRTDLTDDPKVPWNQCAMYSGSWNISENYNAFEKKYCACSSSLPCNAIHPHPGHANEQSVRW